MRVENARRLTGRGFFLPRPGAAVELWLEGDEVLDEVLTSLGAVLDLLLPRLGLERSERLHHVHARGFTVAVGAPIDRGLALADALEWAAWHVAGRTTTSLADAVAAFHLAVTTEADPHLVPLQRVAFEAGVPFLWDDDEVTLGLGPHAATFPAKQLPDLNDPNDPNGPWLDLSARRAIPVGLVTGTNGKTTTTRMTVAILMAAGRRVGATSTDAITVMGHVVETGDWTGPGAARKLLKRPDVDVAVLETARGGLLRRGLAYDLADAALVTNVGADHLGEYGIDTVEAMASVKAVVWQGVREGGKRIANIECPVTLGHILLTMPEAIGHPEWILLARDPSNALLTRHVDAGGEAFTLEGPFIMRLTAGSREALISVHEVPATLSGSARHNVDNALAAASLAMALGASSDAVRRGLGAFGKSPNDNPGRLERYRVGDVGVALDFAHNGHGVTAITPSVLHLRGAGRLIVGIGQAGDRGQEDIDALVRAIAVWQPDEVIVRAMPGYERGRTFEEMRAMFAAAFTAAGYACPLREAQGEVDALAQALTLARPGDLIALLVHYQRDEVHAWLESVGATPG